MYCIYLHLFVNQYTTGFVRVFKNAAFVELLQELGHLLAKNRPLLAAESPPCFAESYIHLHRT